MVTSEFFKRIKRASETGITPRPFYHKGVSDKTNVSQLR